MEYNINLTDIFLEEVEEICNYISINLKATDASNRLREKVAYNILLLENSPRMFPETDHFDREKRNYRKIIINNYIVLYTIDESTREIYVAHMYYEGQNYTDGLL